MLTAQRVITMWRSYDKEHGKLDTATGGEFD